MKKLIIFGNGEMAYISSQYFRKYRDIAYYCADQEHIKNDNFLDRQVIAYEILNKFDPNEYEFFIAIAYHRLNKTRENIYNKIKNSGFNLVSYVDPNSYIDKSVTFGDNCFIFENQTIQLDVKIGNNNIIWSGNHIGHGTIIGNNCFLSSHIVVSGNCKIFNNCFIGVNASIANNCVIGESCFIGMGSQVSKNMQNGETAVVSNTNIYENESRYSRLIRNKLK